MSDSDLAPLYLVIPAGGRGLRMGGGTPKQFRDWGGRPLLRATLEAFLGEGMPKLAEIALAVPSAYMALVNSWNLGLPIRVVEGGDTRQDSVFAALQALPNHSQAIAMIHDGVRPFPPPNPIHQALDALKEWDGAVLGEASTDTLKRVDASGRILHTEAREEIIRAQTPQISHLNTWLKAFHAAQMECFQGTDDVSLLERLGYRVKWIPSPSSNRKITTPEDWISDEFPRSVEIHPTINN